MLFENPNTGAIFSECRRYRYRLWRIWDASKPAVAFLMLNPSTADAYILDPTVTRCMGFAKEWGYGRLDVINLFAFRSTDPAALKQDGMDWKLSCEDNDVHILECAKSVDRIICAWGVHGALDNRGVCVAHTLKEAGYADKLHHIGLTRDKLPKHPLYLLASSKPIKWEV